MSSAVKPSKEAFNRYIEVQKRGVCNMLSQQVCVLAQISKPEHIYIIGHYSELAKEYGKD